MAEKIKCDCGITFEVEERQAHCNYCGIKLFGIGKKKPVEKKKDKSIFTDFSWLFWWRLDKDELQKQVEEYETLKISQSARGISLLFLLFSAVVTTGFILFLDWDSSAFLDVFLFLILGFFIYKGHRWAMIGAMLLWTYEKFSILIFEDFSSPTVKPFYHIFLSLLWWAVYMHFFYLAFRVESLRAKAKMICSNCRKTIEDDSKFCQFCGYKVYREKIGVVKLNTVADYLNLIGMKVGISLKSSNETVTGIVKDLSDDGKYLIIINPENRFQIISPLRKIKKLFSNSEEKEGWLLECNVPLNEIDVIEVIDRSLKE